MEPSLKNENDEGSGLDGGKYLWNERTIEKTEWKIPSKSYHTQSNIDKCQWH